MVTGQFVLDASPVVSVSQVLDHLDERLEEANDALESLQGTARMFVEGVIETITELKSILEVAALEAIDGNDEL